MKIEDSSGKLSVKLAVKIIETFGVSRLVRI